MYEIATSQGGKELCGNEPGLSGMLQCLMTRQWPLSIENCEFPQSKPPSLFQTRKLRLSDLIGGKEQSWSVLTRQATRIEYIKGRWDKSMDVCDNLLHQSVSHGSPKQESECGVLHDQQPWKGWVVVYTR